MRRASEALPPYHGFIVVIELRLSEACRSKLEQVDIAARYGNYGQFWMFCSERSDYLQIQVYGFAIEHLQKVGKELRRFTRAIVLDQGEVVGHGHVVRCVITISRATERYYKGKLHTEYRTYKVLVWLQAAGSHECCMRALMLPKLDWAVDRRDAPPQAVRSEHDVCVSLSNGAERGNAFLVARSEQCVFAMRVRWAMWPKAPMRRNQYQRWLLFGCDLPDCRTGIR